MEEDFILGTDGNDSLLGTPGADTAVGFGGNDTLEGLAGDDILAGNAGEDIFSGGDGSDLILGGRDTDTLEGNAGNDVLASNIGEDIVFGGQGNDLIFGGQGNDAMDGGVGDDTLVGDFGINGYVGGEGADVFVPRTDVAFDDPQRIPSGGQFVTDFILDFDSTQDKIALTNGLQENQLVFAPSTVPLAEIQESIDPSLVPPDVDPVSILDPDGNGVVEVAFARIAGNAVLFTALNTTPDELSGNFIAG